MTFKQVQEKLEDRRAILHNVYQEAGDDLDFSKVVSLPNCEKDDTTIKKLEDLEALNKEINDLADQEKTLLAFEENRKAAIGHDRDVKGINRTPDAPKNANQATKSLGELFVESKAYTEYDGHSGPSAVIDAELKTLFQTSAGWAPESLRTGRVVPEAVQPVEMLDVVTLGQTSQAAVVYMEETTLTNNAAEASEGGAYGEAALALTEQSSTVRKIGVFLPVTDEQMEDVPQITGYVNNRLTYMVRQRLGAELLTGDGVAPNLTGILNVAGIQTQAKGTDPVPDAIYKAITLVRVTGQAVPDTIVLHPNDWQGIRLLRTADGIYIFGSPNDSGPERLWGLPVVQAQAETENTGLVGAFKTMHELAIRRGVEIKVSDSHDDYFTKGKKAIRADLRAAAVTYRPAAFCSVTSI